MLVLREIWSGYLSIIWQLPQVVCGILIARHIRYDIDDVILYRGKTIVLHRGRLLMSLGEVIFVPSWFDNRKSRDHEYGHSMQSEWLGPFYLIVYLLSVGAYRFDAIFHRNWSALRRLRWYYSLPWEIWADFVGGVRRHHRRVIEKRRASLSSEVSVVSF